jgi:hypothetical protein
MTTTRKKRAPHDVADIDLTTPERSSEPRLPHERDEATGATGGVPSARVRQGARDLQRAVQDTSRASEAGRAYEKLKRH